MTFSIVTWKGKVPNFKYVASESMPTMVEFIYISLEQMCSGHQPFFFIGQFTFQKVDKCSLAGWRSTIVYLKADTVAHTAILDHFLLTGDAYWML